MGHGDQVDSLPWTRCDDHQFYHMLCKATLKALKTCQMPFYVRILVHFGAIMLTLLVLISACVCVAQASARSTGCLYLDLSITPPAIVVKEVP